MSIQVRPFQDVQPAERLDLERKLAAYYSSPPDSYYEIADQAAMQYQPDLMPFHCDLVSRVEPGMSILEVGCGTAHLCPFVEANGATYTGLDHSKELLKRNSDRFPKARFLPLDTKLNDIFDVVASLYTIEHVVDPPSYLEQLWTFCRPNGLIAIICPEFVDGDGMPPSFFYGKTPRRFREKIQSFHWVDAVRHIIDLKWTAPSWKKRARQASPGAFWINLRPSEVYGAVHNIDTDAVHLPRLKDMVFWLEQRGAEIVTTSSRMTGIPSPVLAFNCYVVARKR